MIGRTLGGATVAMIQGLIVVVICLRRGLPRHQLFARCPLAILFMVLVAIMFTALGTAIASVLSDFQGFQLIMNFLVMPIFFLSGALVPADQPAEDAGLIASIDPLSYGVDGLAQRADRRRPLRHPARSGGALGNRRRPCSGPAATCSRKSSSDRMNKVVRSADEAVADIRRGATVMIGGFGLCRHSRKADPALVRKGVTGLHTISNNMGIDGVGFGPDAGGRA